MSESFSVVIEEENSSESESYSSPSTSTSSFNDYEEKQRAGVENAVFEQLESTTQRGFGRERSDLTLDIDDGAKAVNAAFTTTRSEKIISNDVEENINKVQPRAKVRLERAGIVGKEQVPEELENKKEDSKQEPMSSYPITIARIENGELMVDDDALYKLLTRDDVKEQPLVIVSIAGAFRTGKSFLLNFFILYLRNKGWDNPNWLGDDDSKIRGCNQDESSDFHFPWKRGVKGCTKGVLVCPEIFQIPLKDGRDAAVLLVDTQGLHDKMLTPDSEARVMSVSMIFGSRQIINIMRQIESTHFTDIELWCRLAAASASLPSNKKSKVFQDLTILIRDYEHGEYAFGDSKGSYLSSEMRGPFMPPELQETCEALTNTFNEVGCFLMPHPGKKVTSCNNSVLRNSDVDEEFLSTIKQFVESVFNQDSLTIKTSNGREANSLDVLDLLGRLGQAYKNGYAPTAQTVMQSALIATSTAALRKGVLEYKKYMEKMIPVAHDEILTAEEMTNANEEAIKLAEACFERYAILGSDEGKKEFLIECKRECNEREFITFKTRIKLRKDQVVGECNNLFHDLRKIYNKAVRQVGPEVAMSEFNDKHERSKEEALKEFDDKMDSFKVAVPKVLECRQSLVDEIEDIYKSLKHERKRMQLVILPTEQMQNSPERHMLEIIAKFRNEADEFDQCDNYNDVVEEKLTKLREKFMEEYDRNTNANGQNSDVIKYRIGLKKELDIILSKAVWLSHEKKYMLTEKCKTMGGEIGEALVKSLEKTILQSHIDQKCFEKYVEEFLSHSVQTCVKNQGMPAWGTHIVSNAVKERAAEYEGENRKTKTFRSVFITKLTWVEVFTQEILDVINAIIRRFSSTPEANGNSEPDVSVV